MANPQQEGRADRGRATASVQGVATLNHILSTSIALFSELGFAATTMRQLADRAEMPISAFYYYYRSKYDVLLAIMEGSIGEGERAVQAALDDELPADEQLAAIVRAHVAYHLESPLAARVAETELRSLKDPDHQRMLKRRRAYEKPFREALERGVREGVFPSDLDVTIAKNLIITMSTGVIDWWRPKGPYAPERIADLVASYAVRMVTAPG